MYYIAYGIIIPIGGRPVHRYTGWPPIGVMIPDAVKYNFDTWSFITREKHRLPVFENGRARKKFAPKM